MTPIELENNINNRYGENTISIIEDEDNIIIDFQCSGEPKVHALRDVKELLSVDDSWTFETGGNPTDDMWIYSYN